MMKENKKSWFVEHWAFSIFLFLIVFWMIFPNGLLNTNSEAENKKTSQNDYPEKLAKFEAEVILMNEMMVEIINRNDYEWTNMQVLANDYYICIEGMGLEPNEKWTLQTHWCKDSKGDGSIGITKTLEKIEIISDQGSEIFVVG